MDTSAPVVAELTANGIPAIALDAYRLAAQRIDAGDPGCHLSWSLLAAIGRVESDHGQFGGSQLHQDGTDAPRVIGIALNGKGTALIRDTDHGRLDGDTVYDHAVGPMQFIPSTWAAYGMDGNGDGRADPFNIFDAALAAASYLCSAGGDLGTPAGRNLAVHAYNDSDQYVALVLALAADYAAGIPVSALPIVGPGGPVTPHHRTVKKPPPVNPVAPPALTHNAKKHPSTSPSSSSSSPSSSDSSSSSNAPSTSDSTSGSPSPSSRSSFRSPGSTHPSSSSSATCTPRPTPSASPSGSATSTGPTRTHSPTPTPTRTPTPTTSADKTPSASTSTTKSPPTATPTCPTG